MKRLFNEATSFGSIIPTSRIEFRTFMGSDGKPQAANRIPIRFPDDEEEESMEDSVTDEQSLKATDVDDDPQGDASQSIDDVSPKADARAGGPVIAELVASRAELKRLQTALAEAQDAMVRRQADCEN